MTTGNAARPRYGFGKPSSAPCHESMAAVHVTNRLMVHDAVRSGSTNARYFSIASHIDPANPMPPSTTSSSPRVRPLSGAGPGTATSFWSLIALSDDVVVAPVSVTRLTLPAKSG